MFYRRVRAQKMGYGPHQTAGAVALGYDPEKDSAPRVLATGKGLIAEQIIAIAEERGIPIRKDPVLLAALSDLDIDQLIPPELYAVVAEVLAFVYRVQDSRGAYR